LRKSNFARGIRQRLLELKRLPKVPQRELAARSNALAGSLLSLMRWWIDRGGKESPAAMDELFHSMVWTACDRRDLTTESGRALVDKT
jgi:hypothetical protein